MTGLIITESMTAESFTYIPSAPSAQFVLFVLLELSNFDEGATFIHNSPSLFKSTSPPFTPTQCVFYPSVVTVIPSVYCL